MQGRIQDFATGGGGRCMLDHLRSIVGPLHAQKTLNFGVSWGGGLKPPMGHLCTALDPPLEYHGYL